MREQSKNRTDMFGDQRHFCDKFRQKQHVVNIMSATIALVLD